MLEAGLLLFRNFHLGGLLPVRLAIPGRLRAYKEHPILDPDRLLKRNRYFKRFEVMVRVSRRISNSSRYFIYSI
jgi:hypothetical protein